MEPKEIKLNKQMQDANYLQTIQDLLAMLKRVRIWLEDVGGYEEACEDFGVDKLIAHTESQILCNLLDACKNRDCDNEQK